MKQITIILCLLISLNIMAAKLENADKLTKQQVMLYLESRGYISDRHPLNEVIDRDEITKTTTIIKGSEYDYIEMSSSDTPFGPVLKKGTLLIVGENSDGTFCLFTKNFVESTKTTDLKNITFENATDVTKKRLTLFASLQGVLKHGELPKTVFANKKIKTSKETIDGDVYTYLEFKSEETTYGALFENSENIYKVVGGKSKEKFFFNEQEWIYPEYEEDEL